MGNPPCPLKETWCGGHSTVPVRDRHPVSSPHTAGLPQLRGRLTTVMASRSRPKDQAVGTTGRTCPVATFVTATTLRVWDMANRAQKKKIGKPSTRCTLLQLGRPGGTRCSCRPLQRQKPTRQSCFFSQKPSLLLCSPLIDSVIDLFHGRSRHCVT
jgi:hypothetical protein